MLMPNAKPRESHFEGRLMHDAAGKAWLGEFIDHWLSPTAEAARPAAPQTDPVGASRRRAQPRVSKVSTR
jgi:hypothetical protein